MADPRTYTVMIIGIDADDLGDHTFDECQVFATATCANVLTRLRRDQPYGSLEHVRVRIFDSAALASSHGMSGKESTRAIGAEDCARPRENLAFRASYIGEKNVRRQHRTQSLDVVDDCSNWGRKDHDMAAGNRFTRVGITAVDSAPRDCRIEDRLPVAADDPARIAVLFQTE